VFGKLLVRDSVELKALRVDSVATRLTSSKRASVRSLDAIQNRDMIALRDHGRYG